MPNPTLSDEQLAEAKRLLRDIRAQLDQLAGSDKALRFAYNRKVSKELGYDERGKPGLRKRLKKLKMKEQAGQCADCKAGLPDRGSVLDRKVALDGYTAANVDLVCRGCDARRQGSRGYT